MPEHVSRVIETPDGPVYLADRDTLARTTGYSAATIRSRCAPHSYDPATGRALYDQDAVLTHLTALGVQPRPSRQGRRRARKAP